MLFTISFFVLYIWGKVTFGTNWRKLSSSASSGRYLILKKSFYPCIIYIAKEFFTCMCNQLLLLFTEPCVFCDGIFERSWPQAPNEYLAYFSQRLTQFHTAEINLAHYLHRKCILHRWDSSVVVVVYFIGPTVFYDGIFERSGPPTPSEEGGLFSAGGDAFSYCKDHCSPVVPK